MSKNAVLFDMMLREVDKRKNKRGVHILNTSFKLNL